MITLKNAAGTRDHLGGVFYRTLVQHFYLPTGTYAPGQYYTVKTLVIGRPVDRKGLVPTDMSGTRLMSRQRNQEKSIYESKGNSSLILMIWLQRDLLGSPDSTGKVPNR